MARQSMAVGVRSAWDLNPPVLAHTVIFMARLEWEHRPTPSPTNYNILDSRLQGTHYQTTYRHKTHTRTECLKMTYHTRLHNFLLRRGLVCLPRTTLRRESAKPHPRSHTHLPLKECTLAGRRTKTPCPYTSLGYRAIQNRPHKRQ